MKMYRIKSKEEIKYDQRDNLWGVVNVSMTYTVVENGYVVNITDYIEHTKMVYDEVNDTDIPVTSKEVIKTKSFNFSYAELNGLMHMIPNLPTGITREDEDERHRLVLLAYVQNDFQKDRQGNRIQGLCIYDTTPQTWILA